MVFIQYQRVFAVCKGRIIQRGDKISFRFFGLESHLLPSPRGKIEAAEGERGQAVNVLAQPAQGQRHVAGHDGQQHVEHIARHGNEADMKRLARIARAHHAREEDVARDGQQVGREEHIERGLPRRDTVGIGRVDAQYELGKEGRKEQHRHDHAIGHRDGAAQQQRHSIEIAAADEVAGERAGSSGQRTDGDEEDGGNVAHDIRHGQFEHAQLLNSQEEDEPSNKAKRIVHHRPNGQVEDAAKGGKTQGWHMVERVAGVVGMVHRIIDIVEHGQALAHHRGKRSTCNAHARETAMAEDKQIVEHDIADDHQQGIVSEHLRARGGHIVGAKEHCHIGKEETRQPPMEVLATCFHQRLRLYPKRQHPSGKEVDAARQDEREKEQNDQRMIEDAPHLLLPTLAIAPPHEYLCARGQAHAEHEHSRIKQTAKGRSPQRNLTIFVATEEGSVRHTQQLIHQHANKDGTSQPPDMSVGDTIRHQGAKVVKGERRAKRKTPFFDFAIPSRILPSLKVVKGERRAKRKTPFFDFSLKGNVPHVARNVWLAEMEYSIVCTFNR